jgi:hypothetical protein
VKPGDYSVSDYGIDNHVYHVSKLLSENGKASNDLLSITAGTTTSFTVKVSASERQSVHLAADLIVQPR